MQTIGIDLAAQPERTAVARIEWTAGGASVAELAVGADDDAILGHLRSGNLTGIDCPLGWPAPFVEFVHAHAHGVLHQLPELPPRRELVLRRTDVRVHETTGLLPLSVAADRIAHPALRLAAILARVGPGVDLARDGSGSIAEVYPAASLRVWGFPHRRYKGRDGAAVRRAIVVGLQEQAPWLDLAGNEAACLAGDDALDAVVCALAARAVALGLTEGPDEKTTALSEGWIHVPTTPLAALRG